jgi:hypothetical protein
VCVASSPPLPAILTKANPFSCSAAPRAIRSFSKEAASAPDLTAYQRDDLGTLAPERSRSERRNSRGLRQSSSSPTNDGRTLSGFLADQDPSVIVLRGLDGQNVTLARSDVREMHAAPTSLMPDGLLNGLDDRGPPRFFRLPPHPSTHHALK